MGSLRNPIGPLPSSIYWRRRAVALALLVLLAVLVVWVFTMGGSGGGDKEEGKNASGGGGVSTITPGPSASGPVNSERPGGRDEADDGGTGSGGGSDDTSGGADGGSDDGGANGTGGAGSSGGGAADGIGTGKGQNVPVGSSLPDCMPGAVELTVRSVKNHKETNTYARGEKPTFEILVENRGSSDCKVDFGRTYASLTITDSDSKHVWGSGDCPQGSATALVRVDAGEQTKRSVVWDRTRSAAHCKEPSGGTSAKPGTYLVEAKVDKLGTARVSFVLEDD